MRALGTWLVCVGLTIGGIAVAPDAARAEDWLIVDDIVDPWPPHQRRRRPSPPPSMDVVDPFEEGAQARWPTRNRDLVDPWGDPPRRR